MGEGACGVIGSTTGSDPVGLGSSPGKPATRVLEKRRYVAEWHRRTQRKEKVCKSCGCVYLGSKRRKGSECKSCWAARESGKRSGEKSPTWRGGHRYFLKGKHGRDKDGLSWKQQRRLAWERDQYSCQAIGCNKKGSAEGWRPDCHHVIPYRISGSHALENLLCFCKSHHKEADLEFDGRLAERIKAPVSKTGDAATHREFESHTFLH